MIYAQRRITSRPVWKRDRHVWHLTVNGITFARIVHHPEGYLSRIDHPFGNGWDCVDFITLAQAKACILNWYANRATDRAFARYYGRGERF